MTFCVLLALAGGLIAILATTGGAAEQTSEEPECSPPRGGVRPDATRVAEAETSKGFEATQFLGNGFYEVSRCSKDGTLLVSQVAGPIEVTEGMVARVPHRTVRRMDDGSYRMTTVTYVSPQDPKADELWRRYGDEAKDMVVPPTSEP